MCIEITLLQNQCLNKLDVITITLDMPADKLPEVIRISEKNAKRIYAEGKFGENYNDVLTRMLDELEELKKKKR